MNKKSQIDRQLLVFPFIFFLILIVVGIVSGAYVFYREGWDSRQAESSALVAALSDCFYENEIAFPQTASLPSDELYEKCSLNKKVIEEHFTLSISVNGAEKFRINSPEECVLGLRNKDFSECSNATIKTSRGEIFILAGTNQEEKREVS